MNGRENSTGGGGGGGGASFLHYPILAAPHHLEGAAASGGTRRVRLVREEGRDVSSQYGRWGEGGGRCGVRSHSWG